MEEFKASKVFFSSISLYSASEFITKSISIIVVPVYAIFLSPSLFGALEIITVSLALVAIFSQFGFSNSLNRYFYESDNDLSNQKLMFSTGLIFLFILNFAIYLIIFLYVLIIDEKFITLEGVDKNLIFVACTIIPLTSLLYYHQTIIRMRFLPFYFFISGLIGYAFPPIFTLTLMYFFDFKLHAYFYSSAIFLLLANIYLSIKNYEYIGISFNIKIFRNFFSYGWPFIFTAIAFWGFSSMDRYFLSIFIGMEEVGQYSIASKLALLPLILFNAFGAAWSPLFMKLREEYHIEKFKEFIGKSLYIAICIGGVICGTVGFFCGEAIWLLFPPEYFGAALATIFLTYGVLLNFTTQVTAIGISISKRTEIFSYLTFIALFFNFIGNYFLIPIFGALGASFSTFFSYLILTCSYFFISQKLYPMKIIRSKTIISIFLCFLIMVLNFFLFSNQFSYISFIKIIFLIPLIYFVYSELIKLNNFMNT
jgi:O-antigen/teichoic acid export membrane protein